MMRQVRAIYDSKNRRQAIERFEKFCAFWQEYEPYAIKCFRDGFFETLHYFEFGDDKNLISSTNHLERDLEEVRRRIKIRQILSHADNEQEIPVNSEIFFLRISDCVQKQL